MLLVSKSKSHVSARSVPQFLPKALNSQKLLRNVLKKHTVLTSLVIYMTSQVPLQGCETCAEHCARAEQCVAAHLLESTLDKNVIPCFVSASFGIFHLLPSPKPPKFPKIPTIICEENAPIRTCDFPLVPALNFTVISRSHFSSTP